MTTIVGCCWNSFATLSRAAAKAVSARLRSMGIKRVAPNWAERAETCEMCPLRVIRFGISYCGRPLLELLDRDRPSEGCGCPTRAKARDPHEHCPLDARNRAASLDGGSCNCKWCVRPTRFTVL